MPIMDTNDLNYGGFRPFHPGRAGKVWIKGAILFCLNCLGCLPNLWAADSKAPPEALVVGPSYEHVSYVCDSTNAEPTYRGASIGQWIQSRTALNPNRLPLRDLLTLKLVSPADDRGTVRFELPVNYDAVKTNWGSSLDMGWFGEGGHFVTCCFAGYDRASNGHSLFWWNVNYDWPGKHLLRARVTWHDSALDSIEVIGPALPFYTSNVCKFVEGATLFDSSGAILRAELRGPIGAYSIELKTVKGHHLKTVSGVTTNGSIDLLWDLTDERGKKLKDVSFDGFFHIIYPGDTSVSIPAWDRFNKLPDPPERSATFSAAGAVLRTELRQQVAAYSVEMKTVQGKHLKTVMGITTNGVVDLKWDLADDRGKVFQGAVFDAFSRVDYPGEQVSEALPKTRFYRTPDP